MTGSRIGPLWAVLRILTRPWAFYLLLIAVSAVLYALGRGWVVFWLWGLVILASWAVVLVVAAFARPVRPISEVSALAARVVMMFRWLWSMVFFGIAAWYGGMVGAFMSVARSSNEIAALLPQVVLFPVGLAGPLLLWLVSMVVGVDLLRMRGAGRSLAIMRAGGGYQRLVSRLPIPVTPAITRLLRNFVKACADPTAILMACYIAPVVLISAVSTSILLAAR